jgi:hypothetical protein
MSDASTSGGLTLLVSAVTSGPQITRLALRSVRPSRIERRGTVGSTVAASSTGPDAESREDDDFGGVDPDLGALDPEIVREPDGETELP